MKPTFKVALLQPRIPDGNYLPNLGIMTLAALLLDDGFDVRVFDENLQPDAEKAVIAYEPHLLGLSCVTAAVPAMARLAERIKRRLPETIISVGGPHVSVLPTETLDRHASFDVGFIGESEKSFPAFCRIVRSMGLDACSLAQALGQSTREGDKKGATGDLPASAVVRTADPTALSGLAYHAQRATGGFSASAVVRTADPTSSSASVRAEEDIDAIRMLPGLAYRTSGRAIANRAEPFLSSEELDSLPFPAWHLLPIERVFAHATHGLFTRGRRIMPIMTSRGCPNYCAFCCRTMGFRFRTRSIKSVIAEIRWLHETFAIDELYIEDDTFTQNRDRAHALLDAIIDLRLGLHIKFANGLRADLVDEPMLAKMKQAGVYWVGFGIESGSAHTQAIMMKRLDLNLAAENVRLAKRMGFKVGSSCILGFPGETREAAKESIRFFARLPLDSFAVVPCVPFPGTTAWARCKREGWLTERAADYENYWFEIFNVHPLIDTPHLPAAELRRMIRRVYLRFYLLSPKRFISVMKVYGRKAAALISGGRGLRGLRSQDESSPIPANASAKPVEDHCVC